MKNKLKDSFPIFAANADLVYLDSGASAHKPASMIDGMMDFLARDYANIHRGLYPLAERATAAYDSARAKVARFLNADVGEVVFTRSTTDGINLLATVFGRSLTSEDEVFISASEHHSNLLPWQNTPAKLRIIPVLPDCSLDLDWLAANIGPHAKIVSITGQSNVLGLQTDIGAAAAIVHSVGAKIIIDAAQLAVHASIDVKALDIDFLAFSGHKVYGPTGIGVLYGKRALLEALPPYQYGGDMVESCTLERARFMPPPQRFEAGTPPLAEAVGLGLAIDFMESVGLENIARESLNLTHYAIKKLAEIHGCRLISSPIANGTVSFSIEGVSPFDVAAILGKKNICVRAGFHCAEPLHKALGLPGSLRVSLGVYNDSDDIDKFIEALKKVVKILK
ncbi:MAG: aminotransferase class V-fold PLP-dependent enzyme [Rickettsiales bacterium]|jgi:cysteine desulfurase/selenocysteine lyase|nr:aminotransferase class V-fold PLP-dependent enzyme [Rickettsiales bacterium]